MLAPVKRARHGTAIWIALPALLVLLACHGSAALAQGSETVFDTLPRAYQAKSEQWFRPLLEIARSLFWKLALIEFAWSSILWVLQEDHLKTFTAHVVRKLIFLGFMFFLLGNAHELLPAIINALTQAGMIAARTDLVTSWSFSPSYLFDSGVDLANALINAVMRARAWDDLPSALMTGCIAILIVASFLVVAAQMLIAMIEGYIAMFAGVLFLGFGGSRWTVEFTQKVLTYAFAVGVKLFIIYLLVAVAAPDLSNWERILPANGIGATETIVNWNQIFSLLGNALFFALLVYQVPRMAAQFIAGAPLRTHVEQPRAVVVSDGGAGYRLAPASTVMDNARGGMTIVAESLRNGSAAVRDAYGYYREAGSGALVATIKAIGTSTIEYRPASAPSSPSSTGTAKEDAEQSRRDSARTDTEPAAQSKIQAKTGSAQNHDMQGSTLADADLFASGTASTTANATVGATASQPRPAIDTSTERADEGATRDRLPDSVPSISRATHGAPHSASSAQRGSEPSAQAAQSDSAPTQHDASGRIPVPDSEDPQAGQRIPPPQESDQRNRHSGRHATPRSASGGTENRVPPPDLGSDGSDVSGTATRTTPVATSDVATTQTRTTKVRTTPVRTTQNPANSQIEQGSRSPNPPDPSVPASSTTGGPVPDANPDHPHKPTKK